MASIRESTASNRASWRRTGIRRRIEHQWRRRLSCAVNRACTSPNRRSINSACSRKCSSRVLPPIDDSKMPRARRAICLPFPATVLELCQRFDPHELRASDAVTLEVPAGRGRTTVHGRRAEHNSSYWRTLDCRFFSSAMDQYADNESVNRFSAISGLVRRRAIGLVVALALIRRGCLRVLTASSRHTVHGSASVGLELRPRSS